MKRNMDIIRKIVLAVDNADCLVSHVDGVENEDFIYHAALLIESGLAVGRILNSDQSFMPECIKIFRLTWTGHDFCDSIKDDTIWEKAKENIIKPSASWTFGILLEYLKFEIKSRIPAFNVQ